MPRPVISGVLFDLFGTLVVLDATTLPALRLDDGRLVRSTVPALLPLVREWIPAATAEGTWHALAGASRALAEARGAAHRETPSRERFRRALAALGCPTKGLAEASISCSRRHLALLAAATRLPPAHARTYARIRQRGPVAVVSNFDDTAAALGILDRHGLLAGCTAVVVSEGVGVRKPSPIPVQTALRELGVSASAALMVGDDAVEDVGAAHAARVPVAWIDAAGEGVPAGALSPTWIVRALPEIEALVTAS